MKEGVRYSWKDPPLKEELNPGENYLEEFDKWVRFKASTEYLAFAKGLNPAEAILDDQFYQEAIEFFNQPRNEESDGEGETGVLA